MLKDAKNNKYTGLQFELAHPVYVVEYKKGKVVNSTPIEPAVVLAVLMKLLDSTLANAPESPAKPKRPSKRAASGKRPGKIAK